MKTTKGLEPIERMEFDLKPGHLALMQRTYLGWSDKYSAGAPMVGLKRPYGNSNVERDVAEAICNQEDSDSGDWIDYNSEGEIKRARAKDGTVYTLDELMAFHYEMAIAIQVVLVTQQFVPGCYVRTERYEATSWIRKI